MYSYVGEGHCAPKSEGPVINALSPKYIVKIMNFYINCTYKEFEIRALQIPCGLSMMFYFGGFVLLCFWLALITD